MFELYVIYTVLSVVSVWWIIELGKIKISTPKKILACIVISIIPVINFLAVTIAAGLFYNIKLQGRKI